MRVFVTGASGFIGGHLIPRLNAAGHEVTALLLPEEPESAGGEARVVRGDVTAPESLHGLLRGHDAVVHLAGAVGYGQTFERCLRLNRDGTENVAREAVRSGARRFVQMSSVSVYGRPANVRVTEDFPLRKIGDPYGDTKIDAERILAAMAERGEIALTLVRPTVIYGPGDDKFLPKLVENLRSGRARVIGSGRNTVDAIHVDDAVEFLSRVLTDERAIGRAYNINHPANPTWRELVDEVAQAVGVAPPRGRIPYAAAMALAAGLELGGRLSSRPPRLTRYAVRVIGRQYHYVVDRAREELGFEPSIDLRRGMRACLSAAETES